MVTFNRAAARTWRAARWRPDLHGYKELSTPISTTGQNGSHDAFHRKSRSDAACNHGGGMRLSVDMRGSSQPLTFGPLSNQLLELALCWSPCSSGRRANHTDVGVAGHRRFTQHHSLQRAMIFELPGGKWSGYAFQRIGLDMGKNHSWGINAPLSRSGDDAQVRICDTGNRSRQVHSSAQPCRSWPAGTWAPSSKTRQPVHARQRGRDFVNATVAERGGVAGRLGSGWPRYFPRPARGSDRRRKPCLI